jgi:signal transduction histidine kinase
VARARAPDREDGVDRSARGGRGPRDQQSDGLHPRQPVPDDEYVTDLRQIWSRAELLLSAIASRDEDAVQRAAAELSETATELDVGFLLQDLGKAIRESQEGSERIRHIVQDLRDFSHQDTGERVLADLNQCLDSTANIVWPMMKHVVVLSKHYADLRPFPAIRCS